MTIGSRTVTKARRWAIRGFGLGSAVALVAFLFSGLSIGWRWTLKERGPLYLSLPALFVVVPLVLWVVVRLIDQGIEIVFFGPWLGREGDEESIDGADENVSSFDDRAD
jgi:hypothetical protein